MEGIYEDIKMCIGPPAQSGAYTHYTSSPPSPHSPSVENLRVEGGEGALHAGQGVWESSPPCLNFSRGYGSLKTH